MRRDADLPGDRARPPSRAPAARRDGDRRGARRRAAPRGARGARGRGARGRRRAPGGGGRAQDRARARARRSARCSPSGHSVSLIRTVTVVDADVDPWDHAEVEWARTAYARPDRDLLVVPGGAADRAEPLELRGRVAKLGIDATRKAADRADHRVAAPPAQAIADARRRLAELRSSGEPRQRWSSGSRAPARRSSGRTLLRALQELGTVETHLVVSPGARRTIELELDVEPGRARSSSPTSSTSPTTSRRRSRRGRFGRSAWSSSRARCGRWRRSRPATPTDLLTRAADVCLKERRRLVLARVRRR